MGKTYPELIEQQDSIYSILKDEETRFFATLEQGNQLLFHEFQKIKSSGGNILSGETAFKLYDTYGFPVDLTELIAKEQGVQVDLKGFEAQVEKAKQLSKSSWKGRALSLDDKEIAKWAQEIKHSHGPTQFLGYQESLSLSKVLGTYPIDSNIQAVAFDKTPIYALGGGQAPDLGKVKSANGESFEILEAQKKNDIIIHFVATPEKLNGLYEISIDTANRKLTARNHSATHLLHSALRNILGAHVSQAGSDVTADRLRFDFTHSKALTIKEIEEVETWVNQEIQAQIPTKIESLSYEEAIKKGALAFFQDKYGDKVRVLSI
jgi:alanyl-tRNA synthetase